ncbi:MAG: acyltransferase [Candidatus Abyssobacteria bacterium SURF_5]|uniref:Acyltransferase n=1 Tax=Abyssobacteria bacterium (strain SURF_5) TaxID=2093360 RepID=A0A3A4P954_ABYX5|nr:MAG: acyltransferase [Candidatus Abyssubacteria bacterium SURF_5]
MKKRTNSDLSKISLPFSATRAVDKSSVFDMRAAACRKDAGKKGASRREERLDLLRIMGLLLIIVAHTDPPDWLGQLRNFDVPLMVMISGAVYGLSAGAGDPEFGSYLRKRIPRLVVPTWTFLFTFFVFSSILFQLAGKELPFPPKTMVASFLVFSGIGYIWIIRVFLLIAIAAPLFLLLHRRITTNAVFFCILLSIYSLYELTYRLYSNAGSSFLAPFFNDFLFYLIPYGCVFALGLRLPSMRKRLVGFLFLTFFCLFWLLAFASGFEATQYSKYPPQTYYLSYALSASIFLFIALPKRLASYLLSFRLISFISASTLWIYLWHILFRYCWEWYFPLVPAQLDVFAGRYLMILSLALAMTYMQKYMIEKIIIRNQLQPAKRKLLELIFLS